MKLVPLLAIAYALLGAAGLTLVIPPGYASPVFPAAGLALACALWFGRRALLGVWLGSALLNIGHAWLGGTLTQSTTLLALIIASGATLQAAGGRWLVIRVQGPVWQSLETERDALRFLVLGGVLSGVLAASVGTTGLAACGLIERAQVSFTWWNWYVGDVLGVLVFAPLALGLLNRSDPLWRERRRRFLIPMLMTLGLVMLAFHGTARWEQQTQDTQLRADGEIIAQRISDRLITHREVLSSLRHFIEATPDFSFAQFEQFTRMILQDNPDIFALSFNDLVRDSERSAFERRVSRLSPLGPYRITERDDQGRLVRAASRPEYVAVRYIVPVADNQPAVGYDIYSEPIRQAAIERARVAGAMAVTAPIRLVQEHQPRVGVLELLPVTAPSAGAGTREEPRLIGFAVAVVKVDELVEIATRGQVPVGLVFQVTDPLAPPGQELLYSADGRGADTPAAPSAPVQWETGLRMGDRPWVLSVSTTEGYRQEHRPWLAWAVGVVGLMFATLLQVQMLGMTGRTAIIQRYRDGLEDLVEERTRQLADTNRELAERSRQTESASRAKTEFLANMSHEIRTPMNAILGLAQVLERDELTDEQRRMLAQIRAAGQSLLGIINDILDLSKIEAGQLRVETRAFDLLAILAQVRTLMGELARTKGLRFRIETPEGLQHRLLGDPLRLQQVLVNLVGNAVKFTERGEVLVRVLQQDLSPTGVRLRLEVQDTGIGIAPEHLAALGKPFTQADGTITRRFGGTGLGLAISQQLVGAMGGRFGCESRLGVGSCFWFELPFDLAQDGDHCQSLAPPAPVPSGPRLSGRHYLAVDDSQINRELIERALKREGASVAQAADGQQALAALRAHPGRFAAVLMDIQMPVMDGLAATRAIRGELALPELPVIAFTAGVMAEQRNTALAAGVNDFLAKPVDLEELVAVLQRWSGAAPPVVPPPPAPSASPASVSPAAVETGAGFPDIPGLDTRRAALLLRDDRAFYLKLLGDFAAGCADAAGQVRADLEQDQAPRAIRRLHTLRGTAGNLGALTLAQRAADLEAAIAAERTEVAPLVEAFAVELASFMDAVAPWVSVAPRATEGPSGDAVLDAARLAALCRALGRRDLTALDLFGALQPALSQVLEPPAMRALTEEIQRLHFDAALLRLEPFVTQLENQSP